MSGSCTLYELLGCNQSSTTDQILAEYRAHVVDVHPDKVKPEQKLEAEKRFYQLQFAKEVLCDVKKRKHYDLFLTMGNQIKISVEEWMEKQENFQQTFHWAEFNQTIPMIQDSQVFSSKSCKSDFQAAKTHNYPRRFEGWTSHNSPTINAFRNYQI